MVVGTGRKGEKQAVARFGWSGTWGWGGGGYLWDGGRMTGIDAAFLPPLSPPGAIRPAKQVLQS